MTNENGLQNNNFITIQAFMVKDLHLKGNSLIIYAVIYGFSQTSNQEFTGSLQYLMSWTNSTKQGVLKVLQDLIDKGYISKRKYIDNGKTRTTYRSTKFTSEVNKVYLVGQQSLPMGGKQSLPNNIVLDNIDDNKECIYIVEYLNEKAGTHYRMIESNFKNIRARLHDYSIDDLKKVIDKKTDEWLGTNMQQYLTCDTLFRPSNFDKYLNAPPKKNDTSTTKVKESKIYDDEDLSIYYDR